MKIKILHRNNKMKKYYILNKKIKNKKLYFLIILNNLKIKD
jgi:hypothetical protein